MDGHGMEDSVFSSFRSIANLLDLQLLICGRVKAGREWRFMHHPAPVNRLYFVFDGKGYIGGKTKKRFGRNLIMLSTVNTFFDYVCEDHLDKMYFHFRLELYPGKDIFDGVNDCLVRSGDRAFFESLLAKAQSPRLEDVMTAKAMLLSAIAPFIRLDLPAVRKRIAVGEKYRRAFAYIDEHCSLALSMKDISAAAGAAEATLIRNFRRDTGMSLKSYVQRRIIDRAQEEVHFTDAKIKEIARLFGFADEFYFSRFFKKHTGLSPAEYRRNNVIR